MADYNSSLPVRTQNPGDVVVKVGDATTPTQQQAVNAAGSAQIAGQGVAGTPAGGVVSIQGVSGGTAVPISGNITVSDPANGTVGSAPPSIATYIGALTGTAAPSYSSGNLEPFSLNLAGGLRVDGSGVTQPVSAASLPLPTGAATSANQSTEIGYLTTIAGALYAQGSTTSGELGSLIMGAATTAAPSYTTAESFPLSLNLAGGLRVDGSGVTQPVSGTVTANQGGAPWSQNLTQLGGATPSASNSLPVEITLGSSFISSSNPLPVTIDPAAAGTFKNYYTDSANVAVGSTATQSTTATGATGFYLQQIVVSGPGKFKAVVSIGASAFWAIFNSTATPTVVIPVPNNTLVPTGTAISVAITNNDLGAQDLYSTISGFQV